MSHTSHGTITISDLTDITDVYLQYGLALANATVTNSYSFNGTGEVGWSTTYPTWQSGYQIWIRQVTEKEGLPNEYGTPYLDTAVNQLNTTISAANANIVALQTKTKKIWTNLNNSTTYPAGTYAASGINNGEVTENNSSTYGYNTFLTHNKLALRYNAIDMAALTTNVLTFYTPTQDSNNNWIQGEKGIELSTDGLILYNPVASTPNNKGLELNNNGLYLYKPLVNGEASQSTAAQLTATGLNITEGSIKLGSNFEVTSAGALTAKSGTIGGWTINDSYGIYTNSKTTATSTRTGVLIQKDGAIYAGAYNSTANACPFQVNSSGELTAISGRIGKFILSNTYLYTGTGTSQAGMGGNQAFWAGSATSDSAPFRVSYAGALNATSGTIGGWTIGNTFLSTSSSGTPGANVITLSKGVAGPTTATGVLPANQTWAFTASNQFGVTTAGKLYASGADISGKITATEGTIGGASISNGTLTIKDANIESVSGSKITAKTITIGKLDSSTQAKVNNYVEYIVGTQTADTNVWTGITKDASIASGKTIAYYLPFAGNSSAATLNLTLSGGGGGTTGAKPVKWNDSNITTHYPANSIITMTYDGENWRTSAYNSDTYNRTRYQAVLRAAEAITAAHIICGNTFGYRNIAANVSFDMTYPLLYAGTTIAKDATSGTRDNNYLEINNIAYTSNGTVTSGAAAKTIFLKGTITGNTFTIAASPFMTTVVPTSEDGYCYIPLGIMTSTTNGYFKSSSELWAYKDGAFGPISIREASAAAKVATNYISVIDENGIRVHATNNPTSNYAKINADGMEVYKGGTSVAKFGETVRLGVSDRLELSENRLAMITGFDTPFLIENNENGTSLTKTMVVDASKDNYLGYDLPQSITSVKVVGGSTTNPTGNLTSMDIPVVTSSDSSYAKSTTFTSNGVKFTLTNYNMFPGWGKGSYTMYIEQTVSSRRYAKIEYTFVDNGINVTVNDAKLNVRFSNVSMTSWTGTIMDSSIVTYGHIAVVNLKIQTTASTAAGGNLLEGCIYSLFPVGGCRLCGYYGSNAIIGGISDDGSIIIRNCGTSSLSVTGNNFIAVSGTYIFADASW